MWFMWTLYVILASVSAWGIGAIIISIVGIINRERVREAKSIPCLKGQTIIITGASSGIGKEAAKYFAKKGARLILACRNLDKADAVAADIRSMTCNDEIVVMELDTSSLESVRRFADNFLEQESRLDVLILNAGMFGTLKRKTTAEGLELAMATNYFGHFLLANLLLGALLKCRPTRVVVTGSVLHHLCTELNSEDLNLDKGEFTQFTSYGQSKTCNILFARHLAHITRDTGVVVNSFCPGLVSTEIFSKTEGFLVGKIKRFLAPFIGRTPWQGAQTLIHLAASTETADVSGEFFENCEESDNLSAIAKDPDLAKELWSSSEKIVKLMPGEKYY